MKESQLQREVRVALSAPGQVFFRNNIGEAEFWNEHQERPDHVAYGVGGAGGSDLLGIVGGRWTALELKAPGARTKPARAALQEQFRRLVRSAGGFATVVRSVDEALAAVARCRAGESE